MEFVVIRPEDHGYWLDPQPYLAAMPEMLSQLPAGGRKFAESPDHYDFFGSRCIKDLWFDSMNVDESGRSVSLTFRPSKWAHGGPLAVRYFEVTEIRFERSGNLRGDLGSVLLDEVLPMPGGLSHEFALTGGTIKIAAADLEALWGDHAS